MVKLTSPMAIVARNVGKPEAGLEIASNVQESMHSLITWIALQPMPHAFIICCARTIDECNDRLDKQSGKAKLVSGLMDDMMAAFDQVESEDDSQ